MGSLHPQLRGDLPRNASDSAQEQREAYSGTSGEETENEEEETPRCRGRLPHCHLVGKDRLGCAFRPAGARTPPTLKGEGLPR